MIKKVQNLLNVLLPWPFAPEPSSGSDGQEIMHLAGSGPNGQANDRRTGQRVGNWAANGAGTSQKVGITVSKDQFETTDLSFETIGG